MVEQVREAANGLWRKITEPAFLWSVFAALIFYIWTASAERERIHANLDDHNNRLLRLESARQADDTSTNARMVSEAGERADIKATLVALRELVMRVEQGQRDLMARMERRPSSP